MHPSAPKEGLHEAEITPSKTFKVDLVEIANKPYVPQEPKATVDFRKINPTRYEVSVEAQEPFWLVFSESYHEGDGRHTSLIQAAKGKSQTKRKTDRGTSGQRFSPGYMRAASGSS
ncbi:hypothetical protein HKBW3S09_00639 [Candidatus Hakubella thermalkaliphila]|uniref:Uncharacterized protein n=3 Tax=Candidatus Hakubella thermalkaliphila TaxID=2754717 RepID=A0A6V8NS53_9ACTN|nr:hypothetical protein [Bacillota bacterium]GFP23172.1 hypothetical protein HKBW3S09_00639 [Candidatus Hakubella thermalkaliphila]GFP39700.1 hypothetical protein HKBW3S47_01398 [Candidatus Hakubella thermalkaliphila]GFP42337.1 hypothetical protein HKBW3C_01463 [Candidatus Hakubella thermalkaliphila]